MPDDQSNIPTRPIPPPSPAAEGITPAFAAAMLGAAQPAGGGWQPPSPEELQRSFPQYEIRGILGRGGMGAVYKGWQKSLDRFVAIKILPPGIDDGGMNFADRFKQEAKAMAKFKHPGIVAVYDAGATPDGLLYFIMECVEGTDVQQLVKDRGRLDPAEALGIIDRVCEALAYAHEHGVVHRDIKPSNVMIETDGTVKVADFGLAKLSNQQSAMLTMSNVSMGTPDFMAPEALVDSAHVDHRADLYAVGVMLYQMLTGKVPRGRFVAPSRAVPGLDKRLDAVVDKALQTEPAARYSSAIELRTAIAPVLTKLAGTRRSGHVSSGSDAHRSARRATRSTLAIAAVVATLCIVAWIAFGKKEPQLQEPGRTAKAEQGSPALQRVEPSATDGRPDGLKPSTTLPAALSPSTEPWVDVLRDKSQLYIKDAEITPQGLRLLSAAGMVSFTGGSLRDGAIRMLATHDPAKTPPYLRARTAANRIYRLAILEGNKAVATYFDDGTKTRHLIAEFPLPARLKKGEDYQLELRAVGSKLTAKLNGKILGEAEDSTLTEGAFGISSTDPALVKALEYLDLGGGARPSGALPAPFVGAVYQLTPGQWMKVFNTEAELRVPAPPLVFTLRDGWIDFSSRTKAKDARIPGSKGHNGGIRLHGKIVAGADPLDGFVLKLRQTPLSLGQGTGSPIDGFATYMLGLRGIAGTSPSVIVSHYHGPSGKTDVLGSIPVGSPLAPGAEFDLEFIAIGDQLIARFNGKALPIVTDTRLTEGYMVIQIGHLIRDVEVINLDGLSEAEARKAAGLAE